MLTSKYNTRMVVLDSCRQESKTSISKTSKASQSPMVLYTCRKLGIQGLLQAHKDCERSSRCDKGCDQLYLWTPKVPCASPCTRRNRDRAVVYNLYFGRSRRAPSRPLFASSVDPRPVASSRFIESAAATVLKFFLLFLQFFF